MKNYTKFIMALVTLVSLSTKVLGYQQTIYNYTKDTISVHWTVQVFADVQKTLEPFNTTNQNWYATWNSAGGCMKKITVTGPKGTLSKAWGCADSNWSVYYKMGQGNTPVGYEWYFTNRQPIQFVNNDTIPVFITYNVNPGTLFNLAPGQKSPPIPGPINYVTVMTPGTGGGQTRSIFDFRDSTGINKVKSQVGEAFIKAHPNFPLNATTMGVTRSSFKLTGYGYSKNITPQCQDTLPWGNACAGQ